MLSFLLRRCGFHVSKVCEAGRDEEGKDAYLRVQILEYVTRVVKVVVVVPVEVLRWAFESFDRRSFGVAFVGLGFGNRNRGFLFFLEQRRDHPKIHRVEVDFGHVEGFVSDDLWLRLRVSASDGLLFALVEVDVEPSDLCFESDRRRLSASPLGPRLLRVRVRDVQRRNAKAILDRRTVFAELLRRCPG